MGKPWEQWQTLFPWVPKSLLMVNCIHEIKRHLLLGRKLWQTRHYFASKCLYCQNCGFPSSHVWKWELDHKEGWVMKNCCFWTVVLEKTLESPVDFKEIKPVNPKGKQPWIFIGRIDAEAPIIWPPDGKSQLVGKDLVAVKRLKAEEEEGDRG